MYKCFLGEKYCLFYFLQLIELNDINTLAYYNVVVNAVVLGLAPGFLCISCRAMSQTVSGSGSSSSGSTYPGAHGSLLK
jgi:hypothetical protein